jgi:hypothetical protein
MSAYKGYYSLVQYCPDLSRVEGANVGVVLLVPERGFVQAKMAGGNDRVRRFFGPEADGPEHLNAMKRGLANRIEVEKATLRSAQDLERFASLQANKLLITKPRFVKISEPEQDLEKLFAELVGGRSRREPQDEVAPVKRLLTRTFEKEQLDRYLRRDVTIHVAAFRSELTVPFAFQNGCWNLIQPARFAQETEGGIRSAACQLAVEGNSIQRHPNPVLGVLKLNVVAAFRKDAGHEEQMVRDILQENDVTLFSWQQIQQLADKIRHTGKPLAA